MLHQATPSGRKARAAYVRSAANTVLSLLKGAASLTWKATKLAGKVVAGTAAAAGTVIGVAANFGKLPELIALLQKIEAPLSEFIVKLPGGPTMLEWLREILARWLPH